MSLSIEEVEHIALLARLELSDSEKRLFQQQLSDILDHVAKLQKLNTANIPPTSSVLPERSVLREDQPIQGLETEEALGNAPSVEDDQFKVPPVLE